MCLCLCKTAAGFNWRCLPLSNCVQKLAQTHSGSTAVCIRHICTERVLHLRIIKNVNIFKWVRRCPAAPCTLAHFLLLFTYASSLWIWTTVYEDVYTEFLPQKPGNCFGSSPFCAIFLSIKCSETVTSSGYVPSYLPSPEVPSEPWYLFHLLL